MEWADFVMFDEGVDKAQSRLEGGKRIRRFLRDVQQYFDTTRRFFRLCC